MKKTDKDSWESFIGEKRDDFDNKLPKDLWVNIEAELPRNRNRKSHLIQLWQVYKYAALFVVALGFGYLAMYLHFTSPDGLSFNSKSKMLNEEKILEPEYVQELAEVETYYIAEIGSKLDQLKTFENSEEIIEELNLLQKDFEELKKEMGGKVNEEQIVRAMIQNYRIRLELLKGILKELYPDGSNIRNYGNETI
jgi:hypothetical protein